MNEIERKVSDSITLAKAFFISQIVLWHFARVCGMYQPHFTGIRSLRDVSSLSDVATVFLWYFIDHGGEVSPLFFLISGFGLYYSYQNKGFAWRSYLSKRVLRILPLYWGATLLAYGAYIAIPYTSKPYGALAAHVLLVQTFTPYYLYFSSLWFMGVLIWFYLLFPFFARWFESACLRWILVIASFLLHPLLLKLFKALSITVDFRSPTQFLHYFIAGMLLARLLMHSSERIHRYIPEVLGVLAAVFLLLMALVPKQVHVPVVPYTMLNKEFNTNLVYFFSMFLLLRALGYLKPVRIFIEQISYASYVLFLINYAFIVYIIEYLKAHRMVDFFLITESIPYYRSWPQMTTILIVSFIALNIVAFLIQKGYDVYLYPRLKQVSALLAGSLKL